MNRRSPLRAMWKIRERLFAQRAIRWAGTFLGLVLTIAASRAAAERESARDEFAPMLEGVWRLDENSGAERTALKAGHMPPEMEFSAAGRFALINIPSSWSNVFGRPAGSLAGVTSGGWTIIPGKDGEHELVLSAVTVQMVARLRIERGAWRIFLPVAGAHATNRISFAKTPFTGVFARKVNPSREKSVSPPKPAVSPK